MCRLLTPPTSVGPIYYVTFTTAVLTASFILFKGFNVTDEVTSMSLLGGFLTIFTGVYLLNFNGSDLDGPLDASRSEYELTSVGVPSSRSSRESVTLLSPGGDGLGGL